jgi:hypothetical protein
LVGWEMLMYYQRSGRTRGTAFVAK